MKLNVTVDLDDIEIGDFYEDGDLTLSEIIKKEIISQVTTNVRKAVLEKYHEDIEVAVEKNVSELTEKVLKGFENSNETFEYTPRYSSKPVVTTIKDLVMNYFSNEVESSRVSDSVERIAKDFVKELKNRYDITFASLIVKNMKEQHLLADDRLAELIKKE